MEEYRQKILRTVRTPVLVCGGGLAGTAAALASVRSGVKTMLIDQYGTLGGMATVGLVGPFMTCFDLAGKRQLVKGIFDELVVEMERRGGAIHPSKIGSGTDYASYSIRGHSNVTPFDPEALKSVLFEKLAQSGVEVLLYAKVIDAVTDADKKQVQGVIVSANEGLIRILADVVVDCTGNGDVVYYSGAAYEKGREGDHLMQPLTLFLRVADVADQEIESYVRAHPENMGHMFSSIIEETRKKGNCPLQRERIGIYRMLHPGEWRINTTRIFRKDGTLSEDMTAAEFEAHRQADELMDYFRKYIPGFQKARLIQTALSTGVRESRRLKGAYTLTLEDLTGGADFDDCVYQFAYPVDVHNPAGMDGGVLWRSQEIQMANCYQIPYRILVPERMDGLLVAGRCVSATHEALGAIRVMPSCVAMGQSAGAAAALCVQEHIAPRDVPIGPLLERLAQQNMILTK